MNNNLFVILAGVTKMIHFYNNTKKCSLIIFILRTFTLEHDLKRFTGETCGG